MFRLEVISTSQAGKPIHTRHDCVCLSSYWSSCRYYLTRTIATARVCQFANDQVRSAYSEYWMSTTVAPAPAIVCGAAVVGDFAVWYFSRDIVKTGFKLILRMAAQK